MLRYCRSHARVFVLHVVLLVLLLGSELMLLSFPVLAVSNVHVSTDDALPRVPPDRPQVNGTFRLTKDRTRITVNIGNHVYEYNGTREPINEHDITSENYIYTSWSGAVYLVIIKNLANSTAAVEIDHPSKSAYGSPAFIPTEGFIVQPGETKWKEYTSNYQCGDCGYTFSFDLRLVNTTSENATATGWWFLAKTKDEDKEPLSTPWMVVPLTLGLVALVSLTRRKKKGPRRE